MLLCNRMNVFYDLGEMNDLKERQGNLYFRKTVNINYNDSLYSH